jgi:hypothetical protein
MGFRRLGRQIVLLEVSFEIFFGGFKVSGKIKIILEIIF